MKVEFEGAKYEMPDDFSPEEISSTIERIPQPRTLLSAGGAGSMFRLIGPGIARGILGAQLAGLEEVQTARDVTREKQPLLEVDEEEKQRLESIYTKRKAIEEADIEIAKIRGAPSRPLEIGQAVVQSVAQNLPGVAAAVAGRTVGPLAAAPGLMAAEAQTYGQEYATARVQKEAEPEAARKHAEVAGMAEVGFEVLPMTWLIKNLGKTGAVEFATKYIGRELATELPTTATQKISERVFVEPDKPIGEFLTELKDELIETALVTPFAAGMTSIAAHGMARVGAGRPEEPAPAPRVEPTYTPPQGAIPGSHNPPLSAPSTVQPTTVPDTATEAQLTAQARAMDPERITQEELVAARTEMARVDRALELGQPVAAAQPSPLDLVAKDVGASPKQEANAPNYINPNVGDRKQWAVQYGPEGTIGQAIGAQAPQPGVYVIGEPTLDRPAEFMQAMAEELEPRLKKYMPGATVVLSNEQLPSGVSLGMSSSVGSNFHLIVPGVLRNVQQQGMGTFNPNTRAGVFFTLYHEFGHALTKSRFYEGATPEVQARVEQESSIGPVSEEAISGLAPLQQAVVREYNALRSRINDGSMTAQEFVNTWLSPGKLAREGMERKHLGANWLKGVGVAPSAPARDIARALGRRAAAGSLVADAPTLEQHVANYFSLDEYLAEQMARHAYTRKWNEGSPLERYLKGIIETLRKMFVDLKQDHLIRPGTSFQEWLDSLTQIGKGSQKEQAATARKMAGTPKAAKTKAKPKAAPKKRERVQHNVETDSTQQIKEQMLRHLTTLELSGTVPEDTIRELYDLLERNEFEEFVDRFQPFAAKQVKFELDGSEPPDFRRMINNLDVLKAGITEVESRIPSRLALAAAEWKEKQFRSRFFKAWFGDWENAPQDASKVRVGLFQAGPVSGMLRMQQDPGSLDQQYVTGLPLVLYHGTRTDFAVFERGDIGFHFGTLRAAHNRLADLTQVYTGVAPKTPEGAAILPVVLNMRNPLYVGSENGGASAFWRDPVQSLDWLTLEGHISSPTRQKYLLATQQLWREFNDIGSRALSLRDAFSPVREAMFEHGYDGMVYDNEIEGDVSFVAFHPNQVKTILGTQTYSRSNNMHWELDYDASTQEGAGGGKFLKSLRNFMHDPGPLRRAIRRLQHARWFLLGTDQQAHLNPENSNIQYFAQSKNEYTRYKSTLMAPTDAVVQGWYGIGKEHDARIGKFLDAERNARKGYDQKEPDRWFDLAKQGDTYRLVMNANTPARMKEHGIDIATPGGERTASLILDAKNSMLFQLDELEKALMESVARRYMHLGTAHVMSRVKVLRAEIHEWRKMAFFPQGRFGNYMITVSKQREEGRGYQVVGRYRFEDQASWEKAVQEAKARQQEGEVVKSERLTDKEAVLMALPTDFIKDVAIELDLNDKERDRLLEILQPVKTDKLFTKYDEVRLGLKGASVDAMRSFADFTWHNANMIAKLKYRAQLNSALQGVQKQLDEAKLAGDTQAILHLGNMYNFMKKTRDYMMAPPYEAQALRTGVAVAYLAANPKTALLNLTSLMYTWSDLIKQYGVADGHARLAKAVWWHMLSTNLTDLNARRAGDYLPPEIQAGLDQSLKDGVTSQSYAYHLAAAANATTLDRAFSYPHKQTWRAWAQQAVDVGMWPFRLFDLAVRRITFLANLDGALEAERAGRLPITETAYEEAVRRTNILQNEFSAGNRAPILRGIQTKSDHPAAKVLEAAIPLATVFMTFMQLSAFHAYGGYELGERRRMKQLGQVPKGFAGSYTARLWLVMGLLAGYEGLPGAESLLDLIEAAWRVFGGQKPIRQELRDLVRSVDGDPQLWARGLGHNVAGFDISRSVGLGQLVPGTKAVAQPRDNAEEVFGAWAMDMAGPTGSLIKFGLELLIADRSPGEHAARVPGGLGNLWTAYKWSQEGVRSPNMARVTHDEATGKLRDLTTAELIGKALGFNPLVVSQGRETAWNQYDQKIYWQGRRKHLLDNYYKAWVLKDREGMADARKEVTKYNENIPPEYRALRVTTGDMSRSVQAHERQRKASEAQTTPQRRYKPLYREIKESYESP